MRFHLTNNYDQRQRKSEKDDKEERTRQRIEQRRQLGKKTGNSTRADERRTDDEKGVAKSERILNSLIEEVRHRKETSVRINVRKESPEKSESEQSSRTSHKKHRKKKRQKEKEHKSKKRSHRSPKSRDDKDKTAERHTKKKRKHQELEGEQQEQEWTKSVRGLRVEVDETKGSRIVVTASDGGEVPSGGIFQSFGYEKTMDDSRTAISRSLSGMDNKQQSLANSESDSDGAESSEEESEGNERPTLANILSAAPVAFPWLTALGNAKKQSVDADEEKAEQSEKKVEQKMEEQRSEAGQKMDQFDTEKSEEETAKSAKKKSHRRRHSSKRSSSKRRRKRVKKKASRSRSRTYSTTPERTKSRERGRHHYSRPSTSKSPTPLPPFSKQRAFETRRKLIEESWHRRIEHSVRPCEVTEEKSDRVIGANGPGESEYTDKNGRIDKQKLLEIATRNATRLAMEGKLPKGAELVETIKNKSVGQLIDLCSKLRSDKSLVLKRHGDASSNSESDEEKRYSHKYEKWQQKEQRREDREFRNRAVRPAGESAPLSRREQREIAQREENTLRLTFPVSSGVQHRVKANAPAPVEASAGPLVRFGNIGPLTTALAKVKTNIPAAYKPLSKPLPTAQPTSSLSTNFQGTSPVQLGPQLPTSDCQPNKKLYSGFVQAKSLDCVNQNVYEIALAASARKEEAEIRDKSAPSVPLAVTSAQFIGPVVPNVAIDSIRSASQLLNNHLSTAPTPATTISQPTTTSKAVFSSSWDRPGHIAAREAFLKKIAEQKQKAEQEKAVAKGTDGSEIQKMEKQPPMAKQMPMGGDAAQFQQNAVNASLPTVPPQLGIASSSSSSDVCATPISIASTTASLSESVSVPIPSPQQMANGAAGEHRTTAAATTTSANVTSVVEQFKKPALPPSVSKQSFVPSCADAPPMVLPTTKTTNETEPIETPQRRTNDEKSSESTMEMEGQGNNNFLDRFQIFVDAQVARQKAESALQATILSTAAQQKPIAASREVSSFASCSSFSSRPVSAVAPLSFSRSDTRGLTKPKKGIQELVAERLRYTQRLQRDPNDYEARKALAAVDKEMSLWAQDNSLPGEFTGNTGARVLSEKELEPSDPRFHAWAKKDQFRTAPEISSGIGMRLLQRMGWQPGQGLGRDRAGQLEPLALDVKADRKGLFSSVERAPTRESVLDSTGKNPVSVLMEQCARNHWRNPEFSCVESGPQNNRRYHWKAVLNGVEYAPSLPSSNKKAAKAQVCMVILEALGLTTS